MGTRLLSDATTPFGRKVMVAVLERGLPVSEEFVSLSEPTELDRYNPLRQIPALVTAEGASVYDSSVILGYLDTLGGVALLPNVTVATHVALADGMMEATLQRVMETRRPAEQQSAAVISRLEGRIARALQEIDRVYREVSLDPLLGDAIAIACALDYVDFRYNTTWRETYPDLSNWQRAITARPSMRKTAPTRSTPATA
jgi:glutathione S-transferase